MLADPEFGEIVIRKNSLSTHYRFSIHPSGRLQISAPLHSSERFLRQIIEINRSKIRTLPLSDPKTQTARDTKKRLLKKAASKYLPYRLEYLATLYGYQYQKLTLTHASTRWGSCHPSGRISLNIGLMNLPKPLIDYVIVHELSHLVHPNHSPAFWRQVEKHDPDYKAHRKQLKNYSPNL